MRVVLSLILITALFIGALMSSDSDAAAGISETIFENGFEIFACLVNDDCALPDSRPVCDSSSTCQGTQSVGVCLESECVVQIIDNDSACHSGIQSQECDLYQPVFCNGAVDQLPDQPSLCATICYSNFDCIDMAHCAGNQQCMFDLGSGEACNSHEDCLSGNCVDGICA